MLHSLLPPSSIYSSLRQFLQQFEFYEPFGSWLWITSLTIAEVMVVLKRLGCSIGFCYRPAEMLRDIIHTREWEVNVDLDREALHNQRINNGVGGD
ncbi:hypothetical protein Leryth_017321 [Lithospermum erythrorhizon]|nr:hypothetical protein Leryth_017321 [Lithospermum erythrorhizon]